MGTANIWVGWNPLGIVPDVYSSTNKKESALRVRPVLPRDPAGTPRCIPERTNPPQPYPRYGPPTSTRAPCQPFKRLAAAAGRAWRSGSRQSQSTARVTTRPRHPRKHARLARAVGAPLRRSHSRGGLSRRYATTESPSMRRVPMAGCTRLLKVDKPAPGLSGGKVTVSHPMHFGSVADTAVWRSRAVQGRSARAG